MNWRVYFWSTKSWALKSSIWTMSLNTNFCNENYSVLKYERFKHCANSDSIRKPITSLFFTSPERESLIYLFSLPFRNKDKYFLAASSETLITGGWKCRKVSAANYTLKLLFQQLHLFGQHFFHYEADHSAFVGWSGCYKFKWYI